MLRMSTQMSILSILLMMTVSTPASAQRTSDPAVTEIAAVDADFEFQGEFYGSIPSSWGSQTVGLQVIAQGEGAFDAVLYFGGLPGYGWTSGSKYKLSGERFGDYVDLRGNGYRIFVDSHSAMFHSSNGDPLAQVVKVHRASPTLRAPPERGAKVLFDGTSTEHFKDARIDYRWLLMEGTETTEAYRDFKLHVEFRLPYMPNSRGQKRANSGVYLQSRYEVQILDSFGLDGKVNECGALYKLRRPNVNVCLPPLQWQTYDIEFTAARFDDSGRKIRNARVSVWLNGVAVHRDFALPTKTGAGKAETPIPLPTKLQDHHNPIRFRNIWIVDRSPAATAKAAHRSTTVAEAPNQIPPAAQSDRLQ